MTNYLNTENQDNLLFKQFQGVVQANINTGTALVQYSSEQRKALNNIFNDSIFSNTVPKDLSNNYWVVNLDNSGGVAASTWVDSSGINQTVGQMQNISKYAIPGTDLTFYKQVYLEPVAATNQAWYCRDPSSANPTSFSTDNNLLKDSIPFLYNDGEPSVYTPLVSFWDGSFWSTQQQNVPNSLNWVFDSASGVLQFYQTDAILNGLNIDKTGVDSSGNPIEEKRPRISFIKYTGPKGAAGGGGGGISDASYNELVQDICDNYLAIQDLSNNNTSDASLNKYFIDIPDAPTDGSGSSIAGESSIILTWTNPIQIRAAFDFYQNITALYPGIVDPLASDLQNRMNYVPFHRNLKLQFRAVDPSAANPPPADWPNLPSTTTYPWTDVSNADISGSSPDISGVLFKDINYATFSITGGSGVYKQDLSTNKYSNEDGVPTGKIFQFRIAQTNLGYVNGSIPVDNSWNYLYIPDISNQYIQLGEFGPPEAPSSLNFFNMTYKKADISGMTLNDADASLNTPFPISYPASTLSVKYQFDLSGGPFNSVQYSTNLNEGQFDVSFVTISTQQNNFTIDLSYNQTQNIVGIWQGTVDPSSIAITQLDVYPEHKYELDGSFCMYNIINGGPDTVDPSCIQIIDISFVSVRPTRTDSNETLHPNSEKYFEDQVLPNDKLVFTNASTTYTVIDSCGNQQTNVYFIDNTDSLQFKLSGDYYTQDNSDNILGIDASGIPCSKYVFDCSNSTLVSDISINTLGFNSIKLPTPIGDFVDTSNNDFRITIFNNDIGTGQKKGGYYSYVQIIPDASTNFIVSQTRYTDSSNNSYDPYDINIKQYYNIHTLGMEIWIPSGEKTFQFHLGWKPPATTFAFNSLTVTNPTTTRDFFGLNRPSTDASVNILFNVNDRNLWWRGSTPAYTIISTTDLFWNKDINSSYVNFDTQTQNWDTSSNWLVSQIVNETLKISRTTDLGSGTPNNNSYCRKGVTTINNPVNQFQVELTYANNVPLPSPQIQYTNGTTQPPIDISFNNKLLFWDFTWKGNTFWVLNATLSGTGVDSTGGFYPDNPSSGTTQFFSQYDHNITIPNNQLMWSGEDSTTSTGGAFRNGNHGSNNENPYIDYSGVYFDNPYDYSLLNAVSSGDTVSIVYSKNSSPGDYYADPIGQTTITEINGIYKWITVKIIKPATSSPATSNKINITVNDHDSTEMTLGTDYILFICEAGAQFTTANSPYTGRTGWKDAARKYDTQLGNITQNTNGAGIYINNGGDYLQLFTSNNVSADLYVRIGLANRNSTTNVNIPQTTSQKSIGSLSWVFN